MRRRRGRRGRRLLPHILFGFFRLYLIPAIFGSFVRVASSFIAPSSCCRTKSIGTTSSAVLVVVAHSRRSDGLNRIEKARSLRNRVPPGNQNSKNSVQGGETSTTLKYGSTDEKRPRKSNNNASDEDDDVRWQDVTFVRRNQYWVVLIDDEESIRQAVGDYLYDSGYQVTACSDAPAFQELIMTQESESAKTGTTGLRNLPDAVVSDIRMPGMDGIALVEWIRHTDSPLSGAPIILLTAKGLTEDRIRGYRAGADMYLSKPFAPEELLGMVDNIIQRTREMKGDTNALLELQREVASIKQLLKRNVANSVLKTYVYLTPTEREVLQLLSKGYTNAEIASERGVAPDRVNRTIQKLYVKTGTKTRTALVRWGLQTGYVPKRV